MNNAQLAKTPQQAVFTCSVARAFSYLCAPSFCHKQLVTCNTKEQAWTKKQGRQTLFCAKTSLVLKAGSPRNTDLQRPGMSHRRIPYVHRRQGAHNVTLTENVRQGRWSLSGPLRPQGISQVLFTKAIKIYVWPVWDKELWKELGWEVPPWHFPPRTQVIGSVWA